MMPVAASAHATEVDLVVFLVHGLMLALFVGWAVFFAWVLFRFRKGRQPTANPAGATGRFAVGVEIGVVVAEGVLLVGFALPIWFSRTAAPPVSPNAVMIRVVAEQFNWNVQYPGADGQFGETSPALVSTENPIGLDRQSATGRDDIVDLNLIHVPVDRLVIIQLSSKDVVHSFAVPAMRIKQDVIPGSLSTAWFTPIRIGRYDIQCAQLCGLGHYRMHGILVVESEADYRQYLATAAPH